MEVKKVNLFRRSYLSLTRRPLKSIIFLLVLWGLSTLLIGSFLVYNSTRKIETSFKENSGALMSIYSRLESYSDPNTLIYEPEGYEVYDDLIGILDNIRKLDGVNNVSFKTEGVPSFGSSHIRNINIDCNELILEISFCGSPDIEGMGSPRFSELVNGNFEIIEGRSFTSEERNTGALVALLPANSIFKNQSDSFVEVGAWSLICFS